MLTYLWCLGLRVVCPTFGGFQGVGTTDLDGAVIHHVLTRAHGTDAHPCKIRKDGAASFVGRQGWANPPDPDDWSMQTEPERVCTLRTMLFNK